MGIPTRIVVNRSDGREGLPERYAASVSGTDLVVIETESTVSGVHGMTRVMDLCGHFEVKVAVINNTIDLTTR